MANVQGPLFSMTATGSIAKTLCYKKGVRGYVARKWAKPSGVSSQAQDFTRFITKSLMQRWPLINSIYQATWNPLAIELGVSPINAYLKHNWERMCLGQSTLEFYPFGANKYRWDYSATFLSEVPSPYVIGMWWLIGEYLGGPLYGLDSEDAMFLYWTQEAWIMKASPDEFIIDFFTNGTPTVDASYFGIGTYTGDFLLTAYPGL